MRSFNEKSSEEASLTTENQENIAPTGAAPMKPTIINQNPQDPNQPANSNKLISLSEISAGILAGTRAIQMSQSPNFEQLCQCVTHCRKMLSRERKPP